MTGPTHIDLRLAVLGLTLIGAVALMIGPGAASSDAAQCKNAGTPAYKLSAPKAKRATLCLINRVRDNRGMGALRPDRHQQRAAGTHNRTMIRKNCFAHQCAGERDLVGRIEASGYLPCKCSWSVSENIAWGTGSSSSPHGIVAGWMKSPPHRANILNRRFKDIGVAVGRGGPGGGRESATYTTDFGFKD